MVAEGMRLGNQRLTRPPKGRHGYTKLLVLISTDEKAQCSLAIVSGNDTRNWDVERLRDAFRYLGSVRWVFVS